MAVGKAVVRDTATGAALGNNGAAAAASKNSGSPSSSTSQVQQQQAQPAQQSPQPSANVYPLDPKRAKATISGEGTRTPYDQGTAAWQATGQRLASLPYNYENWNPQSDNMAAVSYVTADGRKGISVTGEIPVGATLIPQSQIQGQRPESSQFASRTQGAGGYDLGYEVSSNPNVVAYRDRSGQLHTVSKGQVPANAMVVYDNKGRVSNETVNRLGLNYKEGSPERENALRAEASRQDYLFNVQAGRQSGQILSLDQAAAQAEFESSEYARRHSPIGEIVGGYRDLRQGFNEFAQTQIIAPSDKDERAEWIQKNKDVSYLAAAHGIWESPEWQANVESVSQKNDLANRNLPVIGKYYGSLMDWETQRNLKDTSIKRFEQNVQQFGEGAYEGIRQDPASVAEMLALSYIGGAALGAGASAFGRGAAALPAAVRPTVQTIGSLSGKSLGLAGEIGWGYSADLRARGKTIGFDGVFPYERDLIPGISYDRFSPEYNRRIGGFVATEWIPGEIGVRKGFKDFYTPTQDMSAARLSRQIETDNLIADVRGGNYQRSGLKRYDLDDIRSSTSELRRLQNSKTATPQEIESVRVRRNQQIEALRSRIGQDLDLGFNEDVAVKSVSEVERSIGQPERFSRTQRSMEIIPGRDINEPEIYRPRNRNMDELRIGRESFDEVFVGDRHGNWTEVFSGKNSLMESELRVPREVYERFPKAPRYEGRRESELVDEYVNEYDYSYDPDFGNVAERLLRNENAVRYRNVGAYGYTDENAHTFKDENAYKYRVEDEFGYPFENRFAPAFEDEFMIPELPEFGIPEWEMDVKKRQPQRRRKRTTDRRSVNPIAEIDDYFRF